MAEKKVSDTLSQQRKARQDFLELKKMQTGEMDAGPKPGEVAVAPKTFKEKLQHFWFYFKWHTIGAVFTVVVMAILIAQCAARIDYDYKIVYFTYHPVLDSQMDSVEEYFKKISHDLNGDGEINISVINCSTTTASEDYQYNRTGLTKLQSILAADTEALLYITDSESLEFFSSDALEDFFDGEQIPLSEDFYSATEDESFGRLSEGLQIGCRKIKDTTFAKEKGIDKIYDEAQHILKELQK